MKEKNIKLIAVAILLGPFLLLNAQEDKGEKLNRELTLEREYDPIVQDANKISRLPNVDEPVVTKRSIDYSTFTLPANPTNELVILPSGDIMTAISYNKRKGYFHVGGGTFMNINGDLGYHILDTEKDKLNLFISHRSTNGKLKYLQWDEKQKSFLNDNLIGVGYKHNFGQRAIVRLGGKFEFSSFNYYGLPFVNYSAEPSSWQPDSLADRKTNQLNQAINAYAGICSNGNSRIGYELDFEFLRFTQKYGWVKDIEGINQNKVTAKLNLNYQLDEDNQLIGLAGKVNYFNYSYPTYFQNNDSMGYQNYLEGTLTPYYQVMGDNWKVLLGANLMLITGDSGNFFASPQIAGELIIADRTSLYLNLGGEIKSNDAYGLSKQNRYIDHSKLVRPSRTWMDGMLGLRCGAVSDLWFDLFAGYKITDNDVFYLPSTDKYVDGGFGSYYKAFQRDASLFSLGGSLKYSYQKWADFSIKGVYNNWILDKDAELDKDVKNIKPYGKPTVEISTDLTIRPLNPLSLTLGYYMGGNRYTWLAGQEIKLKNISDLNFMGSWNFNDTFSMYVKLNNLLFQEQELLYGYPLQGFNAMAGLNVNF